MSQFIIELKQEAGKEKIRRNIPGRITMDKGRKVGSRTGEQGGHGTKASVVGMLGTGRWELPASYR